MSRFIHLHVHSEYSLLDGLSKTSGMVRRAKELEMNSIALTDHGSMSGAVEFYKSAMKEGIKPIVGVEAYITNRDHRVKESRQDRENNHLVLLAKSNEGYKNLMALTTIAHLEGYYYHPRFDKETFAKYTKGLIVASACFKGEVASLLIEEEYDKAKEVAGWYANLLGGGNYYLEIQRHRYGEFVSKTSDEPIRNMLRRMAENEKKVIEGIVKISRELGIPLVATNDAHYVRPEDAVAQDVLVCIATGKNVSEINRLRYVDAPTFYITSSAEMADLFPEYPDALKNTVEIAERCELTLTLDKWYFPEYPIEKGKTYAEVFTERVEEGLHKVLSHITPEAKERLNYELKTINEKGYAPYFLIVSDFARWCSEHGIITNTRGSAAGSLVSYALGITNINPLQYDLPFERFLTVWRPSPPDIDFDIADDRREEVISYIVEKFGKEKVAQICTFGRMLARAAVRDVARVLGYPYATGDRIAKLIPLGSQGFPMTIERALETTPDLKTLYDKDADARRVIDLAKQIEGNARHVSVHAAGVVIAPARLVDFTPLQLDPEGKKIITQYDMDALDPNVSPKEAVGLLKYDLLGIRNLAILGRAIEIVEKTTGKEIDLRTVSLEDKKTFEMLARGETMGTFQLGGSGMTRYLKELKPTRVEDLMAMVALFRPGPMAVIPEYIARKHNPSLVKYLDPRMKEYLTKSYGLLVYQDDVFLTAINIAGYSWEEADKFRKAVGKKIPAEMAKQKEKFIAGAVENGLAKEKAEQVFALIEPFAAYGFNKAHAASYGIVAYQTAYMKANFPVEYMTALMTAESGDTDKISEAITECRRMGIVVLSPDIDTSEVGFTIEPNERSLSGGAIRFGLSAIKNVGEVAINSILSARESGGSFKTLTDFCRRVDGQKVNRKVLESLIKAGAMDKFGSRAGMLAGLDKIRDRAGKSDKGNLNQESLFAADPVGAAGETDDLPAVSEFEKQELLGLEKALLGFYLTEHPLSSVLSMISELVSHKISQLNIEESLGSLVKIGGVITDIRVVVTKTSGQEMAFVKIEDDTGAIEAVVFPKTYAAKRDLWVKDRLVVLEGKIDNREESLSVVVDRAYELESLKSEKAQADVNDAQESEFVTLVIPKGTSPAALIRLNSLLQSNKGNKRMVLIFENGNGGEKRMVLPFGIDWNNHLEKQAREILGK